MSRWGYNIKMDLKEAGFEGVWTGFIIVQGRVNLVGSFEYGKKLLVA
jgi:hypothetical protein